LGYAVLQAAESPQQQEQNFQGLLQQETGGFWGDRVISGQLRSGGAGIDAGSGVERVRSMIVAQKNGIKPP
jgi:hypothetical protein